MSNEGFICCKITAIWLWRFILSKLPVLAILTPSFSCDTAGGGDGLSFDVAATFNTSGLLLVGSIGRKYWNKSFNTWAVDDFLPLYLERATATAPTPKPIPKPPKTDLANVYLAVDIITVFKIILVTVATNLFPANVSNVSVAVFPVPAQSPLNTSLSVSPLASGSAIKASNVALASSPLVNKPPTPSAPLLVKLLIAVSVFPPPIVFLIKSANSWGSELTLKLVS